MISRYPLFVLKFQSTPSARRATSGLEGVGVAHEISIHALREEGDRLHQVPARHRVDFNPRPPRGGRPRRWWGSSGHADFNPRPPRGGRPGTLSTIRRQKDISIHALREEGDVAYTDAGFSVYYISIHALREEGDSKSGEKIRHVCSIIHTCAQFEKELYEGSGEMQNKSC